jgi:hypothetical protein
MTPAELFDLWAPQAAVWSKWAKPVLFAELGAVTTVDVYAEALPSLNLATQASSALIVDLPGALSVKAGLALLHAGFRPVPLFNGNRGPAALNLAATAIVDTEPVVAWLAGAALILQQQPLPLAAPPAFLLDSGRRPAVAPAPGRFDNRWIVFPQDFPSANFLKSQGIDQVVLLQESNQPQPQEDLAHVLRRWQEAGIGLFISSVNRTLEGSFAGELRSLSVERPSRFRSLWYSALARAGLRRNSAGGFGSVVPHPSSGAG